MFTQNSQARLLPITEILYFSRAFHCCLDLFHFYFIWCYAGISFPQLRATVKTHMQSSFLTSKCIQTWNYDTISPHCPHNSPLPFAFQQSSLDKNLAFKIILDCNPSCELNSKCDKYVHKNLTHFSLTSSASPFSISWILPDFADIRFLRLKFCFAHWFPPSHFIITVPVS